LFRSQLYSELAYVFLSHINSQLFSSRYFSFLAFIYSLHYTHMTHFMLISNNIDWISKHSHSSDIKDSSMKVMSVTSVFIRAKNLNIFSKLLKMTSTVNDLKSNESSDMLMKQNMSISLSITTLTKTDCFSNSLWFHASELI